MDVYQRCPPADEAAEGAVAALGRIAAPCRAARAARATEPACEPFVAELERAVLDVPGCVYAAEPRPEDARALVLDRPALDVTLAPRRAVNAAEARAAAGDIDGAARLVARAVRTAVMLARSDDPVAWVALGALEDWSRLLDGWAGRVSEAALGVVRLDLKAARAGLLEQIVAKASGGLRRTKKAANPACTHERERRLAWATARRGGRRPSGRGTKAG